MIQAAINCSSENDAVLLRTNGTLQSQHTLTIPWSLTLSTDLGVPLVQDGEIVEAESKARLTCPDEEELLIIRGGNVTLANIIFTDCNSTDHIMHVESTCESADRNSDIRLQYVAFQDNQITEDKRIITIAEPNCISLTLHQVDVIRNLCSRDGCFSLALTNTLTNVTIEDNIMNGNGSASHAVFSSPAFAETEAITISGHGNRMRIFSIYNSTLSISDSYFQGNRVNSSSSDIHQSVGGSVIFLNQSTATVMNSTFEENSAYNGGVFNILTSRLIMETCTVRANDAFDTDGGAIYAVVESRVDLLDTDFTDNEGRYGGACHFHHTYVTMRNLTFTSNLAFATNGLGGAIYASHGEINGSALRFFENRALVTTGGLTTYLTSRVSLSDVLFEGNRGRYGAGLSVYRGHLELRPPCVFRGNGATEVGGAVRVRNATASILSCEFSLNTALLGGTFRVELDSNADIDRSSFLNETALRRGGAISLIERSAMNLSNSYFSGNYAREDGGSISIRDNSTLTISNTTFQGNTAEVGGGINLDDSTLTITECNLTHNQAIDNGGGIRGTRGSLTINHSRLVRNQAYNGGGIYLDGGTLTITECNLTRNQATDYGGGIRGTRGLLIVNHSRFVRNQAYNGGGIYLDRMAANNLDSISFANNSALSDGGGIWMRYTNSNVSISNCNFTGNEAGSYGAGLYLSQSNITLRQIKLVSNEASSHAGMYAVHDSILICISMSVLSNIATERGGGIGIESGSSLLCLDCEFLNNIAGRGAGLYVFSNDSNPIVAQLQNSRFQVNNASEYGGGIYFDRPFDVEVNCTSPNVICGRLALLNTDFINNSASYSGSIIMMMDPNGVLISCNYSSEENGFISSEQLESLSVIHPETLCPTWNGNQTLGESTSGIIGTIGVSLLLSMDPNDEAKLVGDSESGFVLINQRKRTQLPTINVTVLDANGNGPAQTMESIFDVEVTFLCDALRGRITRATITRGVGNLVNVVGTGSSGNCTLQINPETRAIAPFNLTLQLLECRLGEENTVQGELCQECDAVSYNFNPINASCTPCPEDASCLHHYIVPKEGYWHKSPCHHKVMRCLNDEACQYQERQQKLADFTQEYTDCNMDNAIQATYGGVLCHKGYEGPLCGTCQPGYGLSLEFHCSTCPRALWSVLTVLSLALYLLVLASFTIRGSLPVHLTERATSPNPSPKPNVIWNSTRSVAINIQMVEMMRDGYVPPEVIDPTLQTSLPSSASSFTDELRLTRWMSTEILKILINFLQVTTIAATINVQWTEEILDMFEASEYAGALTTAALSRPIDCIIGLDSPTFRSIWRTLLILLVSLIDMLVFVLIWLYVTIHNKENISYLWKRIILSVIAVTYISYLGLTKLAVRVFYCVDVYNSESYLSDDKTTLWAVDTSIRCYGKDHFGLVIVGALIFTFVSFSFPLVSAVVIIKNKPNSDQEQGWLFETMGFLYRAFKENLMFWESIVMLRKACLSVIVVFAYPLEGHLQGLLAEIVLILSICAHLKCSPYRGEFHRLNLYEFCSLLVSCFTFLLGQFLNDENSGDFTRGFVSILIVGMNSIFSFFLVAVLLLSVVDRIRVVLKSESAQVDDNARPWIVLKVFFTSRIKSWCQRLT
eukprot:g6336.t1